MSLVYSKDVPGDSVVTRVDWRELKAAEREAIMARVQRVHGRRSTVTLQGDRVVIQRQDDYGTHVEGYLSRAALRGRGRPPMADGGTVRRITASLSPVHEAELEALREDLARERGRSVTEAEVVRHLLERSAAARQG